MAARVAINGFGRIGRQVFKAIYSELQEELEVVAANDLMDNDTMAHMLRWNTPFEGAWFAPFVEVKRDGKALPFQGPMIKRAEPRAEDYLRFDAGQSIDAELDLALPFDLSKPGRYRVQPRIRLHDVFANVDEGTVAPRARAEHQGADLACPALEFKLVASPTG